MTVFFFVFLHTACFSCYSRRGGRDGGLRGASSELLTVALERACLCVYSICTIHGIVSSLMKAMFKCLQTSLRRGGGGGILWWFNHSLSSQPN